MEPSTYQEDKNMAGVEGLIRQENDGTLSFGDYTLQAKSKLSYFEYDGDLYKIKTFHEITKLEKNGMFVYESVPGTAVFHMEITDREVSFEVEGRRMPRLRWSLSRRRNTEYL